MTVPVERTRISQRPAQSCNYAAGARRRALNGKVAARALPLSFLHFVNCRAHWVREFFTLSCKRTLSFCVVG